MSTIAVDNVKPSAGGTSVDLMAGLTKAWLNYNQVTPAVTDSINISSVTDVSAGFFDQLYTSSFANTTYCIAAATTGQGGDCLCIAGGGNFGAALNKVTSETSMQTTTGGGGAADGEEDHVQVTGDLA